MQYQQYQQQYPQQYPQQYQAGYSYPQQPQNMYLERMNQLQYTQQGLSGRAVDSQEQIVANEIPMDGSFAVFPKRDLSEVYIKHWTNDGKIATVVFKPISDVKADNVTPDVNSRRFDGLEDVLGVLCNKVDTLSIRMDELLKTKNTPTSKGKKEVTYSE